MPVRSDAFSMFSGYEGDFADYVEPPSLDHYMRCIAMNQELLLEYQKEVSVLQRTNEELRSQLEESQEQSLKHLSDRNRAVKQANNLCLIKEDLEQQLSDINDKLEAKRERHNELARDRYMKNQLMKYEEQEKADAQRKEYMKQMQEISDPDDCDHDGDDSSGSEDQDDPTAEVCGKGEGKSYGKGGITGSKRSKRSKRSADDEDLGDLGVVSGASGKQVLFEPISSPKVPPTTVIPPFGIERRLFTMWRGPGCEGALGFEIGSTGQ